MNKSFRWMTWTAEMSMPTYAVDDETKAIDEAVEVVSKGHWKLFTP
jgi:dipeptidase E